MTHRTTVWFGAAATSQVSTWDPTLLGAARASGPAFMIVETETPALLGREEERGPAWSGEAGASLRPHHAMDSSAHAA